MRQFNEWMSIRQTNAQDDNSSYQFLGTYDPATIPDLTENSDIIEASAILKIIPTSYKTQFSETQELVAGKSMNEKNKEVVWITVKDINLTYLFEKI